MKTYQLFIGGMHCGSCAGNIERALQRIKGVEKVSVSPITNKAFVTATEMVSESMLKQSIARAGYTVVRIEQ